MYMKPTNREDLLISVVVPIYQVKKYLKNCVDSIIGQSYHNLEIILVDDGSTDGSEKLCDEYADRDHRIHVIHKVNGGSVSARKSGVAIATGEYLVFVDSDDWLEKDYIKNFVGYLKEKKYDILWGLAHYRDYGGETLISGYYSVDEKELFSEEKQKEIRRYAACENGFQNSIAYSLCMKCFKLSFVKDIHQSVDDHVSYDDDFACIVRCMLHTPKVRFVRNDGYHYVQHMNSKTHSDDNADLNRIMLTDTLEYIERYDNSNERLKNVVKMQYIISQIYHGNIGKIQSEKINYLFPYKGVLKESRIVINGMGNAGSSIVNYLIKTNDYKVVACIDKRDIGANYKGIPVYNLNTFENIEFDYILITTIKMEYIDEIRKELLKKGILEKKIAYINFECISEVDMDEFV